MSEGQRPPVKDFTGRVIEQYDTVIYPTRKGSEMWLSRGFVMGFMEHGMPGDAQMRLRVVTKTADGQTRIVYIPVSRVVVLQERP